MCRAILSLDPANAEAYNNLGNLCKDQGILEKAVTYYRKALELKPGEKTAASSLLLCLNYSNKEPDEVFEEHKKWEQRFIENHKQSSGDYCSGPLFPLDNSELDKVYQPYYEFLKSKQNEINEEHYNRYLVPLL